MGKGKTILVAAATATVMTGVILGLAVPQILNRAQRRMLIASASVMAEAFNALARLIESDVTQAEAQVVTQPSQTTMTWPVPDAAFKYAN